MLALVLVLLSQVTPDSRVSRVERVPGGRMEGGRGGVKGWAFFEAFPASGAGTTAACSTTPPTGAKGETLTFTRTGNATCTKTTSGGLATTGIANGDLVVMSANQPRVEYDSAGTLGLLVESARTNSLVRSESIDNAVWTSSTGAGAVTVTADYATAPDGTLTADRLQVAACPTVGLYSARLQSRSASISTDVGSVFLKGTSGSGSIGIMLGGAATYWASTCTFNASTWTRCSTPAGAIPAASEFWIGCLNNSVSAPNPGNTGAADVLVWGAQDEVGAYATSYIPTTSAAEVRNAETATFTVSPAVGPSLSLAANGQWGSTAASAVTFVTLGTSGANELSLYRWADTAAGYNFGGVGTTPTVASMGTTSHRTVGADNAGARSAFFDGVSVTAPAGSLAGAQTLIGVGTSGAGAAQANGIISRICLDPSPTRCR